MAIRIPGIIALMKDGNVHTVRAVVQSPQADRHFSPAGPLFNRLIAARIRHILQADGKRLPGVAPRDYPGRAQRQAELDVSLGVEKPGAGLVAEVAMHILGRRPAAVLGPLLQAAVGRLFSPQFRGGEQLWQAAQRFDEAPRKLNPLTNLIARLTRSTDKARAMLVAEAGSDPAAIHAIAIAVRSLERSVAAMRDLAAQPGMLAAIPADEAVRKSLCPPATIVRQVTDRAEIAGSSLPAGALCQLELGKAYRQALAEGHAGADGLPFLSDSWSHCPAESWVRRLLGAAWQRAAAEAVPPRPLVATSSGDLLRSVAGRKAAGAALAFRRLLGVRLGLDVALALLCLILPSTVMSAPEMGNDGAALLTSLAVTLLATAALQIPAVGAPVRWRWPAIAGMAGRIALALAFAASEGLLRWVGWFDLLFGAALVVLYYRLFVAELQSRP